MSPFAIPAARSVAALRSGLSLALALTAGVPAGVMLAVRPVLAAPDLKLERVTTSRVVTAKLPEGTARLGNTEPLKEVLDQLRTAAKDGGFALAEPELLLWNGASATDARSREIKAEVEESLKKAGYQYQVAGEKKVDQGTVTLFVAGQSGKDRAVLGAWTAGESFLLLTWGEITPLKGGKAGGTTAAAAPEKARPATTGKAGSVDSLRGTWGFTTISGTTYWDKATGAYLGGGTGGSQSYTFEPGGKYRMFNYIRSRTGSWTLETLTWEEGTVRVEGDQLVITPTGGKYQVKDNQVARNNYTRPMKPEEIQKNAKRCYWSFGKDSRTGRAALMMGKSADAMVQYTRSPED